MGSLQTKPLIPEWVRKLAEALLNEKRTYKYEPGWDTIVASELITQAELEEFIWMKFQEFAGESP